MDDHETPSFLTGLPLGRSGLDEATAQRKLHHYVESLHMLEVHASDDPLVRHLRFELEMLRALPPVGAAGILSR